MPEHRPRIAEDSVAEPTRLPTSIATVCLSGPLPDKLEAAAAAGFDGVEIFENDFLTFDGRPGDVGRMVRDQGLEIVLFQPFRDFEGMPEPHRGRAFDRAERKFDLMAELGTDLVLICSNVSPAALGGIDRAAGGPSRWRRPTAGGTSSTTSSGMSWGMIAIPPRRAIVSAMRRPETAVMLAAMSGMVVPVPSDVRRSTSRREETCDRLGTRKTSS